MTKEQAIELGDSYWWKNATPHEIVGFQFYEDRLCMDFGDFHGAMEAVLGRPVFTHEFAYKESMQAELEGKAPKKTFQDVLNLLPKGKVMIIVEGETP